jgi:hypothetical protein
MGTLPQICAQFLDEQSSSEARAEWTAKLAPLLELISGSGRQSEYAIATVRELLQTYLNDEAPFGALPPTANTEVPCPGGCRDEEQKSYERPPRIAHDCPPINIHVLSKT